MSAPPAARVGFISLGCPKNLVDTESMIGLALGDGFAVTNRKEEADVLVVNTCGFIEAAKKESIEAILEAAQEKLNGRCRALVVSGCLVSRYPGQLAEELPEVDAFIGTADYPRIAQVLRQALGGTRVQAISDPDAIADWNFNRVLSTPRHTAYLKIAEGCNCACAFCSIPIMRGLHRSRPMESVLDEARRLAAAGVQELIVIAQDPTYYGLDLYGQLRLPELLRELARMDGLRWVRVHYLYPTRVSDALIDVLAAEPRIVKYLDIPFQHGSARLLKIMNRPPFPRRYLELVARLRERIPDACVRSTFIAGHPGESESDFAELLDFIRAADLDHVGVFAYSPEEDTPAGQMADQVPADERERRRAKAMAAQQTIALRRNREQVGRTLEVLVEGRDGQGWQGRCYRQSPGIDGCVFFSAVGQDLAAGRFVPVEVTGIRGYDLVGRMAGTPEYERRHEQAGDTDLVLPVIRPTHQ